MRDLSITGGLDPVGGIEVQASGQGITLDRVDIYGNTALGGGGIHVALSYNDAGGASTGVGVTVAPGGTTALSNSILWGHTTSVAGTGTTITCSDIQGGRSGTGNIALTPFFVSAATGGALQPDDPLRYGCRRGGVPGLSSASD